MCARLCKNSCSSFRKTLRPRILKRIKTVWDGKCFFFAKSKAREPRFPIPNHDGRGKKPNRVTADEFLDSKIVHKYILKVFLSYMFYYIFLLEKWTLKAVCNTFKHFLKWRNKSDFHFQWKHNVVYYTYRKG